eukprot:TRINITY_DN49417_c0_g1_i1.p1 TRINITY_DN49417_c0_g1~~TRINITY_DN49417_c0_g1_i1.p1  ORF type:complete len:716 (+),score=112.87 TRINITY_DN49417_c0_g1_i1:61-2208(+)
MSRQLMEGGTDHEDSAINDARLERSNSSVSLDTGSDGDAGDGLTNSFMRKQLTKTLQNYYRANISRPSITIEPVAGKGGNSKTSLFYSEVFVMPRSVVKRALQNVDHQDSPDTPGEMSLGALLTAVHRFHSSFGQPRELLDDQELIKTLGIDIQDSLFDPNLMVNWNVPEVLSSFNVKLGWLERLYFTLDMGENSCIVSRFTSIFMFAAVMFSILLWVAGTMEGVRVIPCEGNKVNVCVPREPEWMESAEMVCVCIFTAEIILRLVAAYQARRELLNQRYIISLIAGEESNYVPPSANVSRLLSFFVSIEAICDILSVAPFWAEMAISSNGDTSSGEQVEELSVLRILYVVRVARIFKLGRALNADLGQFNEVQDLFRTVMKNASPAILMTFLLIVVALFFFGTFIWFCERGRWVTKDDPVYQGLVAGLRQESDEQGAFIRLGSDGRTEELSPFESIPSAFWWTIVTITTVGYGDQVPYTPWGKAVGGVTMLYGTVILGLPLFVVGATFGQEYDRLMKAAKRRQELQASRAGSSASTGTEDKAALLAKATGSFIEEHALFTRTIEEARCFIGIPEQTYLSWQHGLRTALLDPTPAVSLDNLTMRILSYLAETQEMWQEKNASDELAACRKIRLSWHKLVVSCCQLGMVPREILAKVLDQCLGDSFTSSRIQRKKTKIEDKESGMDKTMSAQSNKLSLEDWVQQGEESLWHRTSAT